MNLNTFFKKKSILFLAIGIASLIILTVVGLFYASAYFQIITLWILSIGFFVLMRLPNSWKMGLEVFYLFTFIYAYVFNLLFVLPLLFTALLIVLKIRPDEGSGCFVHAIVLTGTALTARLFFNFYGPSITEAEFVFAVMFTIVVWLIADTIVAVRIAPVPLPKLIINHALDFTVNYFVVTTVGFRILKFFLRF